MNIFDIVASAMKIAPQCNMHDSNQEHQALASKGAMLIQSDNAG